MALLKKTEKGVCEDNRIKSFCTHERFFSPKNKIIFIKKRDAGD